LDVADIDATVCWGPGLPWGVMRPNLLFHLGGGDGGIHQFMEHLAGPISACWKDLGNPELTAERSATSCSWVLFGCAPGCREPRGEGERGRTHAGRADLRLEANTASVDRRTSDERNGVSQVKASPS